MEQKHIKVRLLILWAHQTGQGPFATLPNEMLHLIFRFQGQPQWLPNSFSGPAGSFSLSSDKTTIKVTGLSLLLPPPHSHVVDVSGCVAIIRGEI